MGKFIHNTSFTRGTTSQSKHTPWPLRDNKTFSLALICIFIFLSGSHLIDFRTLPHILQCLFRILHAFPVQTRQSYLVWNNGMSKQCPFLYWKILFLLLVLKIYYTVSVWDQIHSRDVQGNSKFFMHPAKCPAIATERKQSLDQFVSKKGIFFC